MRTKSTRQEAMHELASKLGYGLRHDTSRVQTPERQGGWMIVDASLNIPVFGWHYDLTLDDVERWLTRS